MSKPHEHITERQACSMLSQFATHLPDLDQASADELLDAMPPQQDCPECKLVIAWHIPNCTICKTKFNRPGLTKGGGTLKFVD